MGFCLNLFTSLSCCLNLIPSLLFKSKNCFWEPLYVKSEVTFYSIPYAKIIHPFTFKGTDRYWLKTSWVRGRLQGSAMLGVRKSIFSCFYFHLVAPATQPVPWRYQIISMCINEAPHPIGSPSFNAVTQGWALPGSSPEPATPSSLSQYHQWGF